MAPCWGKLLVQVALLALWLERTDAVDESKFRTCQQGSFCRRYRKYIERVESRGEFAHSFDPASLSHNGHKVSAQIRFANDPSLKPLNMELSFFRDAVESKCGIVRLLVNEVDPLHQRFQLKEGDVVLEEASFGKDDVSVDSGKPDETQLLSSAPGGCKITIRHKPFEIDFSADGRILQRLNSRHLMNFEQYRPQGANAHAGLVDASDEDSSDLFQENFAGHSDSKPRGPSAVGLDVTFESAVDITGLAEHAAGLHLAENGFHEPYRFYNLDVFEYALDVPSGLYGAIPFATAIHRWPDGKPSTASGIFWSNPSEGFVKVEPKPRGGGWLGGSDSGTKTWWLFEAGIVDIFMFAGPTPHNVLQQYHTVTGMPRMPPLCSLGKHQSRWNYVDVEDSINVNKGFDRNDIPYDFLWLDIDHTDGKKYFTWHPTHFADPDKLLNTLAESKRKLVTIVDPHIKREAGYGVFDTLKNADFMTKTKTGEQYDGWCWPGTSFYPDFCNPEMRNQWAKFFHMDYYPHNRPDLYTWNDMNEPSVFNGPEVSMPRDNLHKCHTTAYGVEHREVHNVYGYYHHGATVQGQLERAPDVRPFVLTRSFFAGSHRHSAMWTGDNMARWNHLERSVPMLLSLSMCGMSFGGADVPGFFFDPEPELFKRWHQLGIWYPFYRGHAHLETKRREPWMLGDEITANMREQVTARYQMMPTWYTIFAEWAMLGLPILRPLWYHNLDDIKAFEHVNDHFLVGDSILVRAIGKAGMTSVPTYLPMGSSWYNFWDAKAKPEVGGAVFTAAANPSHIPVFVKAGSILFKKMRRRRSTGAMVSDPYTIFVYGASAKGHLYIDDGESHKFQSGAFIFEDFEFDGTSLRERAATSPVLSIGASKGLGDWPKRQLRVERAVFVGLSKKAVGAKMVHGTDAAAPADNLQVTSELASDGVSWVATVKKPTCLLGSPWSLELSFE